MKFLYNVPALLYRKALIVGDTHFGIERRLRQQGIRVLNVSEQLADKLINVAKENKAKKIIFLGDVKDPITTVDPITKKIFQKLKKEFELIVVRGNHDGGIEELDVKTAPSEGLLHGELGLIHGHAWPDKKLMKAKYLVSAHQHPQIAFTDAFGKKHTEPIWVVAQADAVKIKKFYPKGNPRIQLIVVPAFNPLVGSTIGKLSQEQLGPLLNNNLFKWNEALMYKLGGNSLGKINDT